MADKTSDFAPLAFPRDSAKPVMTLSKAGHIFTLTMTSPPDNRFNPTFVKSMNEALDIVEDWALKSHRGEPCALITTSSSDKFYSNGLDVMYLFKNPDTWFISDQYLQLLKRVLLFPVITVAALNGHTFAGGLLFALCHDYRILRADKGLLSLNEIDLPSSLHPGMAWIARAKLPPTTVHPLIFEPKRYGGQAAVDAGLVDAIAPADQLLAVAHKWANQGAPKVARAGPIVSELKLGTYADVVEKLDIRMEIDVRKFMKPKM
ncbi:hypothetical protein GGF31_008770 [Allomyces arbusculus]|nr:hypothetical protein GGF31_008770 [Allomyces arbusculus]